MPVPNHRILRPLAVILLVATRASLASADAGDGVQQFPPAPPLGGKSYSLGTYEIRGVSETHEHPDESKRPARGTLPNLCKKDKPHYRCGQKVWVVRNDNQIAIIEAMNYEYGPPNPKLELHSVVFDLPPQTLLKAPCSRKMTLGDAVESGEEGQGLFNSDFCRSFQAKGKRKDRLSFYSNSSLNPRKLKKADQQAVEMMIATVSFGAVGFGSDEFIYIDALDKTPPTIRITTRFIAQMMLMKGTQKHSYQLVRVGD